MNGISVRFCFCATLLDKMAQVLDKWVCFVDRQIFISCIRIVYI